MYKCTKINDCKSLCCNEKRNIFSLLNPLENVNLFKDKQFIEFKSGETIFKEHLSITHIACIKEGYVKMSSEANHGKTLITNIFQPGDVFGGMGIYVDETHQATCTALTDVKCCLININSFKKTLENNNYFAIELIKKINISAIKSKQRTINLTSKSMYSRVADMLIYLSETVYKKYSFQTYLKRQDMADYCAITKESMIRIMKEFKEKDIISINSNHFTIHKPQELKKISKFN